MTHLPRPAGSAPDGDAPPIRAGGAVLGAALVLGLLAAAAVRVLLMPSYVLLGDLDQYARWAHHLATEPFGTAYEQDLSYMPVLVGVFGALGRLVPAFATASDASDPAVRVVLKIPALLGEVAIAAGFFALLRDRARLAAIATLAVVLVPATWYLGAWWGQLDAVYVAVALWTAVLALRGRRWSFAVLLGLALMTKPQALFLAAPFAGFAIGRWGLRRAAAAGLVAAGVAALTWVPFLADGGLAGYLRNLDYYQNGQFPILSVMAWNPWWLLQAGFADGLYVSDAGAVLGPLTPRHLGIAMTLAVEVVVLLAVLRRPTQERLLLGLAAATLAAFGLMTSMHERYAFAALVFLAPLLDRRSVQVAWVTMAVTISLNVLVGTPPDPIGPIFSAWGMVGIVGSVAMIAATLVVFGALLGAGGSRRAETGEAGSVAPLGVAT